MGALKYLLKLGTAAALSFLPIKNTYAQNILNIGNNGKSPFLESSIKTEKLDCFSRSQYYDENQESSKNTFLDLNIIGINPLLDYSIKKKSSKNTEEKITSYLRALRLNPNHFIMEAGKRQETNKIKQTESNYEVEQSSGANYNIFTSVDTETDTNIKTVSSIESFFAEYDIPLSRFISIGPIASYTKIETGINGSSFVKSIIKTTGTILNNPYTNITSTETTTPIKSNTRSTQKAAGLTAKLGPCIVNAWRVYDKNKWQDDLNWEAYLAFKFNKITNIVDIRNLGSKDSKLEYALLIPISNNSANLRKSAEFQKNKDKINKSVSLNNNQKKAELTHLEKNFTHNNLADHLKIFLAMNRFNGQLKPSLGLGYISKNWNIETLLNDDYKKIDLGIKNIGISATKPENKEDKISWNAYMLFPLK